MSVRFINRHRTVVIWLCSLFLIGLVFVNGWFLFQQLTTANPLAPANPIASLPNGQLLTSQDDKPSDSYTARLPLIVSVGGMLLFAMVLGGFNVIMIRRANKRDDRRRQDLHNLAQALEAYYNGYGHYPVSSSYQEGYYRAILITNEWKYYDLPADEVMKTYLPQWPLSDPRIPIKAKDQTGNYLYYPQQQGQFFSLYAVLERGTEEAVARQDGLGQEFDYYTYRLTSQRGQPAPPPTVEPNRAVSLTAGNVAAALPDVMSPDALPPTAIATPTPIAITPATENPPVSPPPPSLTEETLPVIQASTLPLDVRLAQGTAAEVQRTPELDSTKPQAPLKSLAEVSSDQAQSINQDARPEMPMPPRRRLTFSQLPPTNQAEAGKPLEAMPPLLFGEEDSH